MKLSTIVAIFSAILKKRVEGVSASYRGIHRGWRRLPFCVHAAPFFRSVALPVVLAVAFSLACPSDSGSDSSGSDNRGDDTPSDDTSPGEVSNISISYRASDGMHIVSWTNPDDSDLSYIEITWEPNGPAEPIRVDIGDECPIGGSCNYEIAGLAEGDYTIIIRTVDASGNQSDPPETEVQIDQDLEATIISMDAPGAVSAVSISYRDSDQMHVVSWTNPDDADLSHIEITYSPAGPAQPARVDVDENCPIGGACSYEIAGLTDGETYTIAIHAVDEDGNRSAAVRRDYTPEDNTPPGEVSSVTPTYDSRGIALIAWTNPSDSDLSHLEVTWMPAGPAQPARVDAGADCPIGGSCSYELTGLTDDETYTVEITAIDTSSNRSSAVSQQFVATDDRAPGQVSNVRFVIMIVSDSPVISVFWTNPVDLDIQEVEISWKESGETAELGSATSDCDGASEACSINASITGVMQDDSYDFTFVVADLADNSSEGVTETLTVDIADLDNDLVPGDMDNCPFVPNSDQANFNGDAEGDACDDSDGDGVVDANDNCRDDANADQADGDGDRVGNACDNCPAVSNPGQINLDTDQIGDLCDTGDTDGDGVMDMNDLDVDGDGLIEVRTLEMLHNMRYVPAGDGYKTSFDSSAKQTTGCPSGGSSAAIPAVDGEARKKMFAATDRPTRTVTSCVGYELARDLDFRQEGSYDDPDTNMPLWAQGEGVAGWHPIGCGPDFECVGADIDDSDHTFQTQLHGNGYTIRNLFTKGSYIALFGFTSRGAYIHHLGLANVRIRGGNYAAGLVAYAGNGTIVEDSFVTGDVQGSYERVGGLSAFGSPTIKRSYVNADVYMPSKNSAGNYTSRTGGIAAVSCGNTMGPASHEAPDIRIRDATSDFAGNKYGILSATYMVGTVQGGRFVGVLLGDNCVSDSYRSIVYSILRNNFVHASLTAVSFSPSSGVPATIKRVERAGKGGLKAADWENPTNSIDPSAGNPYPTLKVDFNGDGAASADEFGYQLATNLDLQAANDTAGTVTLTWDNVDTSAWTGQIPLYYSIYRRAPGQSGNGALIASYIRPASSSVSTLMYMDNGSANPLLGAPAVALEVGKMYQYRVVAVFNGIEATRGYRAIIIAQ